MDDSQEAADGYVSTPTPTVAMATTRALLQVDCRRRSDRPAVAASRRVAGGRPASVISIAIVRSVGKSGRARDARTARHASHDRVALAARVQGEDHRRSEEHTSELQSLMRNPYAVFCL